MSETIFDNDMILMIFKVTWNCVNIINNDGTSIFKKINSKSINIKLDLLQKKSIIFIFYY